MTTYRTTEEAFADVNRLLNRVAELEKLAVYLYNHGYGAGHNDTVEGCYTDIHRDDMREHHSEEVQELIADAQQAALDEITRIAQEDGEYE